MEGNRVRFTERSLGPVSGGWIMKIHEKKGELVWRSRKEKIMIWTRVVTAAENIIQLPRTRLKPTRSKDKTRNRGFIIVIFFLA